MGIRSTFRWPGGVAPIITFFALVGDGNCHLRVSSDGIVTEAEVLTPRYNDIFAIHLEELGLAYARFDEDEGSLK